jgi:diguanylate cyclase (GGDEF)-like protein
MAMGDASALRVLIAEPSAALGNALRKFLDGRAEVQLEHRLEGVLGALRSSAFDVVIASVGATLDGEALVPYVRNASPQIAVVLSYPPSEVERAPDRARELGVEGFWVGPPKKHVVLGLVHAVARLNGLAGRLAELSAQVEALKVRPRASRARPSQVALNAPDEAFFKRYMLLEIKRGKRYRYPVALLLVSLDRFSEHLGEAAPDFQRAAIRSEALEVLSVLLRDIDVAMPFGEDKYLVFLPHTPLQGSTAVAGRVVEALGKLESFQNGTVSVGVASFEPSTKAREHVSFGGMVREASAALKQAQALGGNRYHAPLPPPLAKKNRISLG